MTPQEALKVLNEATAQLNGNRQTHLALLNALKTLEDHVNKIAPQQVS